ncbi:MAG: PspC domain-containing protein [Muribaculaceae bacterium]|nr:PspC domain-containing protein [Muribaculaceae bacterium]
MKKSFPVNINGRIYNIDEDAYGLLHNYLDQLRTTFPGDEGREIVDDIEARVAELFDERIGQGGQVITIEDVNRIIGIMGRPEDLGEPAAAEECGGRSKVQATPPPLVIEERPRHKLYRDIDNKVMGGVLSGIATYFGSDPNLIRVLMIILTICTAFWPCFVCYLIAWAVIPPADTARRRLELRGEAVSVEAVGRGVLTNDAPRVAGESGFTAFINVLAKCAMGFIGLVAGCVGLAMLMGILCLLGVIIALPFGGEVYAQMASSFPNGGMAVAMLLGLLGCFLVLLPCIALFWLSLYVIFGVRGCGTGLIIGSFIIWVIIFVAVIVLSLMLGANPLGYTWWLAHGIR